MGDPITARAAGEEGRDLADAIGDRPDSRICLLSVVFAQLMEGDVNGAVAGFRGLIAEADHDELLKPVSRMGLGVALAHQGEFDAAHAAAGTALEISSGLDDYFQGMGHAALAVAALARGPLNHPHRDEHTRKRFRGDDIPTGSLRGDTNTAQMRSAVAQCLINEMGVVSEVDSVFFQLGSQLRWPRNPQVRTACPAEGLEAFRPAVEPKPSQPAADRPPARSTAKTIGGVVLSGTAVVRRYSHRGHAYIANWRTTVPPL